MMGGYGTGAGVWIVAMVVIMLLMMVGGWAMRRSRSSGSHGGGPAQGSDRPATPEDLGSAQRVLRERYARGEISAEEMDEKMRALKRS